VVPRHGDVATELTKPQPRYLEGIAAPGVVLAITLRHFLVDPWPARTDWSEGIVAEAGVLDRVELVHVEVAAPNVGIGEELATGDV